MRAIGSISFILSNKIRNPETESRKQKRERANIMVRVGNCKVLEILSWIENLFTVNALLDIQQSN